MCASRLATDRITGGSADSSDTGSTVRHRVVIIVNSLDINVFDFGMTEKVRERVEVEQVGTLTEVADAFEPVLIFSGDDRTERVARIQNARTLQMRLDGLKNSMPLLGVGRRNLVQHHTLARSSNTETVASMMRDDRVRRGGRVQLQ